MSGMPHISPPLVLLLAIAYRAVAQPLELPVQDPEPPWLVRQQQADGGWLAAGAPPARRLRATGLAVLALCESGSTHRFGRHKRAIARGLAWLRARQDDDGQFGPVARVPWRSQLPAGLALVTLASMTRARAVLGAAGRFVSRLLTIRDPRRGWRGLGRGGAAGRGEHLYVLRCLTLAGRWPKPPRGVAEAIGAGVAASRAALAAEAPPRLADHLLIVLLIDDTRSAAGRWAGALLDLPDQPADPEARWTRTCLAFRLGGERSWSLWNHVHIRKLLAARRPDGSWPPPAGGSAVEATALAVLTLHAGARRGPAFRK